MTNFCHALQSNPVEAVESVGLQQLIQFDRHFYRHLAADYRWRLLFGLGITLLDFADGIDLNAHFLSLPGSLPSLSLWQICDSLVCIDFQLDGLDWSEELDWQTPLSMVHLKACTALLSAPETIEQLDRLIEGGLSFIESCDEFPIEPLESADRPQRWQQRLWRWLQDSMR